MVNNKGQEPKRPTLVDEATNAFRVAMVQEGQVVTRAEMGIVRTVIGRVEEVVEVNAKRIIGTCFNASQECLAYADEHPEEVPEFIRDLISGLTQFAWDGSVTPAFGEFLDRQAQREREAQEAAGEKPTGPTLNTGA